VALGAILAAVKVTGKSLRDQTVVFLGAGSASIGVADYLRDAMIADGLSPAEAVDRFWIVDKDGLLREERIDLTPEQKVYARRADHNWALADVIGKVNATVLIGLSTARGAFTEPIVREMARKTERPIIFPLSNPTERSEATAEDLISWTNGKALVASGSPFDPVAFGGRKIPIAQCNNVYIFPAVGLGLVASGATRLTDAMMQAAARALAEHSPALANGNDALLPPLHDLRGVAVEIAMAVGLEAQKAGLAPLTTSETLRENVSATHWKPQYPEL
jgi:malate dehydrogenase (oxaloacetate-decarboxylating)